MWRGNYCHHHCNLPNSHYLLFRLSVITSISILCRSCICFLWRILAIIAQTVKNSTNKELWHGLRSKILIGLRIANNIKYYYREMLHALIGELLSGKEGHFGNPPYRFNHLSSMLKCLFSLISAQQCMLQFSYCSTIPNMCHKKYIT